MSPKRAIANGKAKMVFYGMRQTSYGRLKNSYRYTRHYVAVESPDVVVKVVLELPDNHWKGPKKIDIEEEMNKMAKKFFPKAEIFMFYNRVSHRGIMAAPPEPTPKASFTIKKSITR